MIETSSAPPRKSSATFGNLRKMFGDVHQAFGTILENLRKSSESGRKSSKTSLLVCLCYKKINTWTLGDMEFIFSCSHLISHSFAALTSSISM